MGGWLQRLRGALGMGITWALGWAPIGAALGLATGIALGTVPLGIITVSFLKLFAVLGFLGGTTFAAALRLAEGHRSFDDLSIARFAALGALGGFVLGISAVAGGILGPAFTLLDLAVAGVPTLLGAGSAAGVLWIARRAEDRERIGPGPRG